MKLRKHYTKKDKMRALFELSLGKSAMDALEVVGFDVQNSPVRDKKYALKLTNKWKQEIYLNNNLVKNINREFNRIVFENEELFKNDDFIARSYFEKLKERRKERFK